METAMNGRVGAVCASPRVDAGDPEHGSGVGPAPTSPLTSSLVLGALPTAPSCARLHASALLYEWDLGELAEEVELVVSELVTNAVQASEALRGLRALPTVQLWLSANHQRVLVQVWDGNNRLPEKRELDVEA